MTKIPQISEALQTVLTTTADAAAQKTGFTQRQSKLTGSAFVQTLVLGWLSDPAASLDKFDQYGCPIRRPDLCTRVRSNALVCIVLPVCIRS